MLQNAYLLAKIGADTAENEQHFAKILPTDALLARPRRGSASCTGAGGPGPGAACGTAPLVLRPRGPVTRLAEQYQTRKRTFFIVSTAG